MDPLVASGVNALRERRAVADLSTWTKVFATGPDAGTFLGDLVSGDVAGLGPGRATRSLLLTPTGRIRADFTVARVPDGYLLVQSPDQPDRIDLLLSPYVLSADVELRDLADHRLVALISEPDPGSTPGASYAPGALGRGADVLIAPGDPDPDLNGLTEVSPEALEAWRILEGRPRFPIDLRTDSLPAEAGLDEAIDYTKGCFLGQESVAKVRNLGHPPVVVLAARADGPVRPGEPVLADGVPAGGVTSRAEDPDGGAGVIVRVRWEARDAPLATEGGPLTRA